VKVIYSNKEFSQLLKFSIVGSPLLPRGKGIVFRTSVFTTSGTKENKESLKNNEKTRRLEGRGTD
jgi:hypothetical protein